MNISEITSVELDRTKPFDQKIYLKRGEFIAEEISVNQTNANEILALVTKKWWEAIQKKEK